MYTAIAYQASASLRVVIFESLQSTDIVDPETVVLVPYESERAPQQHSARANTARVSRYQNVGNTPFTRVCDCDRHANRARPECDADGGRLQLAARAQGRAPRLRGSLQKPVLHPTGTGFTRVLKVAKVHTGYSLRHLSHFGVALEAPSRYATNSNECRYRYVRAIA